MDAIRTAVVAREQGAAPPPPGVVPNFVDPPNRNTEIIAVSSVCIAISTIFIAARTFTRLKFIKRHGWEDCKRPQSASQSID